MIHLKLPLFVKKMFYSVILITSDKPTFSERMGYWLKIIMCSAPVAAALEAVGWWYKDNSQFVSFVLVALLMNMGVGIAYHIKMNTFSWREFFKRNIAVFINVITVYILLEMLRLTAGSGFIGETFKVLIQITTLLYPTSKALKNIYVLNNKKFPPAFMMDRIYNFEKNGNIKDLFNQEEKNEDNGNIQ